MYGLQSGRTGAEKESFYDDLRSKWDLHSVGELVLGMGDFNGHVSKQFEDYEGVHGGNGIGERNLEGTMLEFCDERSCVWQTHGSQKGREEESDVQHKGKWVGD